MASQFLTCVFKLHNPSRHRRELLYGVMEKYTVAMDDLLNWCYVRIDGIRTSGKDRQGKYTSKSIAKCLPAMSELSLDASACLKESLIDNVSSMLASYFELEGKEGGTGFPTSRDVDPQAWNNALLDLALVGDSLEDETRVRDRLTMQARGSVMPLPFIRSRDFALLYDVEQDRFFVALKLLAGNNEYNKFESQGNLLNLCNGMAPFVQGGRSWVLFPMQVGKRHDEWHWQYHNFLVPAMSGQAGIQASKIIEKEGDYFLHVAFAFECPDKYEPRAFLGIDRGILYTLAYGLVDLDGRVMEMRHRKDGLRELQITAGQQVQRKQQMGRQVTARDYRGRQRDNVLHELANYIVAKAVEHQAMIVMESLNIMIKGKFVKSAWSKLEKYIAYRAKLNGVSVRSVFAAKSSMICIHCGELVERDDRVVTCRHCGKIEHSDEAAGVNIARRAMYKKKDWEKIGGYRAFHRSFSNLAGFSTVDRVEKRLSQKAQDVVSCI